MNKLAVIILNWNGEKLLKEFLPAASKFTCGDGVKLFVADNGSEDGSVDWVKENHPEVGLLEFEKNYGFAEGYNKALRDTGYPFTVLLNSDVEVTEGWWQPLLEYMEKHPETGALQPKIKSFHEKSKFEYAGAAGGYLDRLGYPYCRGRIFEKIEEDRGQYDGVPEEITWASGACLMVRNEAYWKAGGLDPLFFAHMEEIDLCVRMINAGYKVMCVPYSEVFHVGGASLNQGNSFKTYLNFRNNLLLLHKNTPEKRGKKLLFIRRLVDTLAILMFAVKGDMKNAKAVIKAHSDFKKMRGNYKDFPTNDALAQSPGPKKYIILEKLKFH